MKTIITFLIVAVSSLSLSAQFSLPVGFEESEEDTAWTQFANAGDAPENFVLADNPDNAGINTSAKCINFIVLDNADPWVGAWSDSYGSLEFTADNHIMTMMVHKDVITDCALKVEGDGVDALEVHAANTVTGEWELLTFDFTDAIGNTYNRLVFFPDFPDPRTAGSNCYIDNIGFQEEAPNLVQVVHNKFVSVYPNPASEIITVQYPGMIRIAVSNVAGQIIRSVTSGPTDIEKLDISDLNAGLYIITIEAEDGTRCSRFVKQ